MENLTELIADAKAEEEVAKMQRKPAEVKRATTTVTIPLEDYNGLRDAYRDLQLILNTYLSNLDEDGDLTYTGKDNLKHIMTALYPDVIHIKEG